jgi:Tol biopolymer transport system component
MWRHALAVGLVLLNVGCGGQPSSGEPGPLSPGHVGFGPTWSFDGETITYVTSDSGSGRRLASVNADGTNLRQISDTLPDIDDVAGSPTRRELLVVTSDGELPGYEHRDIQILRGNRQIVNLTRTAADESDAAWSPDGNNIAFAGADGAIYVISRDGTNRRKLTSGTVSAADSAPEWSPDGRTLAFRRSANEEYVYVVDVRRGKERRLTSIAPSGDNTNLASWGVAWTRDGRAIVTDIFARISVVHARTGRTKTFSIYASDARPGPGTAVLADAYAVSPSRCSICPPVKLGPLVVLDLQTGKTRRLLPKRLPKGITAPYAIDAAWSPDGRRIAAVLITGPTSDARGLFIIDQHDGSIRRVAR